MTDDHDGKISDLYQQSSQETPPAHVDRAVMGRARKSVRRRAHSPFGNNWVAGAAMAGVVMLSVLLLLDVPQELETFAPAQDAVAPLSEALPETSTEMRKEKAQRRALSSDIASEAEDMQEQQAAPKARFDFYRMLPEMEVAIPEEEDQGRLIQLQKPAAQYPARTTATAPAETWYLQAGSFRDKQRAAALKARLSGLGFQCEVQEVRIDGTDVFYRVRVGPFTDPEALDQSKRKLDELGFDTQTVSDRE